MIKSEKSQKMKDYWANLTPEQKAARGKNKNVKSDEIKKTISIGMKKYWDSMTEEQKQERNEIASDAAFKRWNSLKDAIASEEIFKSWNKGEINE